MNLTRFPSGLQLDKVPLHRSAPSMLYIETEAEEPTPEDIEEFARRIGIDPETEPHLIHLARSGLLEKLPPEWKPCKDTHRDAWFYYNNQTKVSQWEHPLDAVYKQKVIEARTEHAMNRLQNFDLGSAKPLKSLPPLKKGGGLAPLAFPNSLPKPKLGPLKHSSFSSSDELSQYSAGSLLGSLGNYQRPNGLQPLPLEPLTRKSASLGNGELSTMRPDPLSRQKLDPGPLGPVKKSGLTLTGSGASFLKSAKPPSSQEAAEPLPEATQNEPKNEELQLPQKSKLEADAFYLSSVPEDRVDSQSSMKSGSKSGSEDEASMPHRKPLKSILADSNKRSRLDVNSTAASAEPKLWDINSSQLTDHERNMWSSLNSETSMRKKPNVKFDLEDPKITFEFSRDESDEDSGSSETEGSEEDEEEEDEEEVEEEEEIDHSKNLVKQAETPATARPNSPVQTISTVGMTRVPMQSTVRLNDAALETNHDAEKLNIKANMDHQLKTYEQKIQQEQKEKENEIRSGMEASVAQIKADMEAVIDRMKVQFEAHKKHEVEKARREMETSLSEDLERVRGEFKSKLEQKKLEIQQEHEEALKSLTEKGKQDLESLKSDPRIAEAEKDYEVQLTNEIKRVKAVMDEQHLKQLEEMRSLHQMTLENLKLEFQAEEEKLRQEHSQLIAEMISKFDAEKQNLMESFQQEQEKIKQEFSEKAMQMTQEFSTNFQQLRHDLQEKMDGLQALNESHHNGPVSLTDALSKTDTLKQELADMRQKYQALEEKYLSLNKRISQPSQPPPLVVQNPPTDDSFPIHYGNRNEAADLQSNTFDSGHSGAAESDSSFTSSSSGKGKLTGHKIRNSSNPTSEPPSHGSKQVASHNSINQDSLSKALMALEDLKNQISELKREQRKLRNGQEQTGTKQATERTARVPGSTRTRSNKSAKEQSAFSQVHVSVGTSSGPVSDTNISLVPVSKDVSSQVSMQERKYVDEAKDFIKSQKYRLSRAGLSIGAPVATAVGSKQRYDARSTSVRSQGVDTTHLIDHHSETESSGVGSLKELSNNLSSQTIPAGKNKVSEDIEGILSSLQQLDSQMKYLWSFVGDSSSAPGHNVPATLLPFNPSKDIPMPLNPGMVAGKPTFLNSFQVGTSPIRGYHGSTGSLTSPMAATFNDHVASLRNRQSRILRQYPLSTDPTYTRTVARSPSITEKTRDLREWLDKF